MPNESGTWIDLNLLYPINIDILTSYFPLTSIFITFKISLTGITHEAFKNLQ